MGILLNAFNLTPAAAVEYLRKRKLRVSENWYDLWKEEHTRAFTVAKMLRMDLLQTVRGLIDAAVNGELAPDASGEQIKRAISFQEFQNRLIPELKKKGWWGIEEIIDSETGEITERRLGSVHRLKTIYETNINQSYHAGRYRGQMEAIDDLPYMQYKLGPAMQHTEQCARLQDKIFRADDPVWDVIYPRNHWGCHAYVVSLTERQVGRMSGDIIEEANIVSRTETVGTGDASHPVNVRGVRWGSGDDQIYWCGAGWDYNPGKTSFTSDLNSYDNDIAALWGEQ